MKKKVFSLIFLLTLSLFFYNMASLSNQKELLFEVAKSRTEYFRPYNAIANHVILFFNGKPLLMPSQVIESSSPEIQKLANSITEGKESDQEKSKAIYDWVIRNIQYDTETYYDFFQRGRDFDYKTALETLHSGESMCVGYSRLNAALHRAAGIEAKVVYGPTHAFNEIKLDGVWEVQDSTNGSGYINSQTKRFTPNPDEMYFSQAAESKSDEFLW